MFERYTEQARRALFFARYEVSQLGSVVIDTEHLLLGLIRESKGLCGPIFARFGISREDIRRELEGRSAFRERVATPVEIPFSKPAKRVLQFAAQEADALSHNYIGTEHLLLGILREERSVAGSLLIAKGLALQPVRDEIGRLLSNPPAGGELDTTHFADEHPHSFAMGFGYERVNARWTVQLQENAYWFHSEGQAPEGPYCVRCWEQHRRWVRKEADASRQVVCQYCGEGGGDS
jgi:ATP-dependent Clp protease ATP-binding subunit ClpA